MSGVTLTTDQFNLLEWLGKEDYCQYGECFGPVLDALVNYGYAQIHKPGEHQSGFIAQDHIGAKGIKYCAVSLTDAGRAALRMRLGPNVVHQPPTHILVNSEIFGNAQGEPTQTLQGPVRAIFLDGEGEMWCAYELADIFGVQVISLGSTFFLGFTND